MSGRRTIVVIFFFWALLTIITPTLVHLSESAKLKLSLNGENIDTEVLRARKAFGFWKKPLASKPSDTLRTKAPVPAPSLSPSPEPQPASSRLNRIKLSEILDEEINSVSWIQIEQPETGGRSKVVMACDSCTWKRVPRIITASTVVLVMTP